MRKTNVFVAHHKGEYYIKVEGRATFEHSSPLRNLIKNIKLEELKKASIDLSLCTGMDSTFMGVLAMIAVRVKQNGDVADIIDTGENNKKLLNGLGLKKLFNYRSYSDKFLKDMNWEKPPEGTPDKTEKIETVIDSHQTLMNVDKSNIPKFENVVDLAKKDLEKTRPGSK